MTKRIVRQLAHVCIFARDVQQTADFYRDVLGLQIKFRFSKNGAFFGFYLDCGGQTNIEVFHKPEAEFEETDRINHICLEVTDLDTAVAHIRAQGVEVTEKKRGVDLTWQAWLKDPNGTKIELFEYTPESMQFNGGVAEANW
jgi:glyoxylase I family protein